MLLTVIEFTACTLSGSADSGALLYARALSEGVLVVSRSQIGGRFVLCTLRAMVSATSEVPSLTITTRVSDFSAAVARLYGICRRILKLVAVPPVSVDDFAAGVTGVPVYIAVLANDTDPDGDPLIIDPTSLTTPSPSGTVTIEGDL